MNFEFDMNDIRAFIEDIDMTPEDMASIVEKVAQAGSDNIERLVPVDLGITKKFWYPSSVRVYPNQAWETVFFDPKKFGKVGNSKSGWIQRKDTADGWGWGWIDCFHPKNRKNYMWLPQAIRKEKAKVKKQLEKEVENYISNK